MAFFNVKANMELVPKQRGSWKKSSNDDGDADTTGDEEHNRSQNTSATSMLPTRGSSASDPKDKMANDLLDVPSQREFIQRLDMLHEAIESDLMTLVNRKGATRVSSAQYIRSHSRIRHLQYLSQESQEVFEQLGCDFGKLYDIKLVFDQTRGTNNRIGYPEKEFVALAAPAICPTYPNALTSWFNMIDVDGTGFVDWPKLSTYLLTVCANMNDLKGRMSAHRYDEIAKGRLAASPGYQLLRMIPNTLTKDTFFCVCNDGNVREYSTKTMKSMHVVHHGDGTSVSDMKFLPERNQIYVAQESGLILIYDGTGECTRTGTVLKAMRVGRHPPNEPLEVIRKSVKFDPLRMIDAGMHDFDPKVTVAKVAIEVCPLKARQSCHCIGTCKCNRHLTLAGNTLKCIEPVYESVMKSPAFFTGYENGYLAYHRPDIFSTEPCIPVGVWKPHNSWVTKLQMCTAHAEIRGLVSSSTDSSIAFTDAERLECYAKMSDRCHGDDGGGWVNGARPITSFDISQEMPLIVSCGNMRSVSFWAGDSRKKVAVVHDHKANVIDVCFNQHTHQAVSLGEDRTIRIWDTRMYRVMQVIPHKDHLTSVMVEPETHSICTGTGIVLQHSLIDEDDVAAVAAASAEQGGTVTSTMVNPVANQLVTCDGMSLSGWDINDGGCYFTCKLSDQITAWTMDAAHTKFFVATADGNLSFIMYGSPKPARQYHLGVAAPVASLMHLVVQDLPPMIVCGLKDGSVMFFGEKTATAHLPLLYSTHLSAVTGVGAKTVSDAIAETNSKQAGAFSPGGLSQASRARSLSSTLPLLNTNSGVYDPLATSFAATSLNSPDSTAPQQTPEEAARTHERRKKELQELQKELGAVNLMAVVKGNVLTCCTSGGYVAVLSLHPSGPVVFFLMAFDSKVIEAKTRAASAAVAQMRANEAEQRLNKPRPKTGHLWQRVLQATKKERDLSSAQFTKFRHEAQMLMKRECESVVVCSQTHVMCTFGNGDAVLLKISGKTVDVLGLFPLSCGSGCACVAVFKFGRLYVADDTGALSVFELDTERYAATTVGNVRYFVNFRIKLVKSLRLPSPIVDLSIASKDIVSLVVEAPRPVVVNVEEESLVWGPRMSIGGVKNHRFADIFPGLVANGALLEPSPEQAQARKKQLHEANQKRDRSSSLVEATKERSRSGSRIGSLNTTPLDTPLDPPGPPSSRIGGGLGGDGLLSAPSVVTPASVKAAQRRRSSTSSVQQVAGEGPQNSSRSTTGSFSLSPRAASNVQMHASVTPPPDHADSGDENSPPLSALAARKKKKKQRREEQKKAAELEESQRLLNQLNQQQAGGDDDGDGNESPVPATDGGGNDLLVVDSTSIFDAPLPAALSPTALSEPVKNFRAFSQQQATVSPTLSESKGLAETKQFTTGAENTVSRRASTTDSDTTQPPPLHATPTQLLLMGHSSSQRHSIQLESEPIETSPKKKLVPTLSSENATTDHRMNLLFTKYVPERRAHTVNFLRSHNTGPNKKAASEAPRALASVKAKKAAKESEADPDSRWYRRLKLEQLVSVETPSSPKNTNRFGGGGGLQPRSQTAMANLYGGGDSPLTTIGGVKGRGRPGRRER